MKSETFIKKYFLNIAPVLALCACLIILYLNEFSLDSILALWVLILFSITRLPYLKNITLLRKYSSEFTTLAIIYTLITILSVFKNTPLTYVSSGKTLFLFRDNKIFDIRNFQKSDNKTFLDHYAYFEFLREWNKSKNISKSLLHSVDDENWSIHDSTVSPSLLGLYSGSGESYDEEYFKMFKIGETSFAKFPVYLNEESIQFKANEIKVNGRYCNFSATIDSISAYPYDAQWVNEKDGIELLKKDLGLSEVFVAVPTYEFRLECPFYMIFSPALKKYKDWFIILTENYEKQMNWLELQKIFLKRYN